MNSKKIIGIALVIIGAALLLLSNNIAEQVATGKVQTQEGQEKVDTVNSLFSKSQYTKPVGKQITSSGQRQIDQGNLDIAKYEAISNQLRIAGIILIVIGVGIFFFWKKRK